MSQEWMESEARILCRIQILSPEVPARHSTGRALTDTYHVINPRHTSGHTRSNCCSSLTLTSFSLLPLGPIYLLKTHPNTRHLEGDICELHPILNRDLTSMAPPKEPSASLPLNASTIAMLEENVASLR